ncbi:MAG: VWA domain-containing protein [Pyrinomonadaceae bacterium]
MTTTRRNSAGGSRRRRHRQLPLPCLALAVAAALLAIPAARASRAQQQPSHDEDVISVNSDLVVLNVTATDAKGGYVHGLRRGEFKVFEDGSEQAITNFSEEETPFAAVLLLDISSSMEGRVTLVRSAAIRFLDGLRDTDVAAVYDFHTKVEQVQEFSNERDLTERAFGLHAKGLTVLNDAVVQASKDLSQRPERRRAILVLSDGADTHSKATSEKALDAALAAGATIYAVYMGERSASSADAAAEGALRNFAAKSGGRYVATPGGGELREAFAEIVEELSNQYTVGYHPTNRARDGRWRTIEVKVSRPDVTARTRRGYRLAKR